MTKYDQDVGWQEDDVFDFGRADNDGGEETGVAISLSRIAFKLMLIGVSVLIFILFFIEISQLSTLLLKDLSENFLVLLILLDILLLLKSVEFVVFLEDIFVRKKVNLKLLLSSIVPVTLLSLFFFYMFYVNEPFDVRRSLNFATSDPASIALPILLGVLIGFSVPKLIYRKLSFHYKKKAIGAIEQDLVEASIEGENTIELSHVELVVYRHLEYSFLLFFLSLIVFYLLDVIIFVSFIGSVGLVVSFNVIYFYRSNNPEKETIRDKIEEIKEIGEERKFGFLSIRNFIVLGLIVFGIISYLFDLFLFKTIINKVGEIVFFNPFMLTLLIINVVLFVLSPVVKILSFSSKKIGKLVLQKVVMRYFFSLLFAIIALLSLKIFLFNLEGFPWYVNLDPTAHWLISIFFSLSLYWLSVKLSKKSIGG